MARQFRLAALLNYDLDGCERGVRVRVRVNP